MSSKLPSDARVSMPNLMRRLDRLVGPSLIALIAGLWITTRMDATTTSENGQTAIAAHDDGVISFAQEQYHGEVVLENGDTLRLFILGPDPTRVSDVEVQTLAATVRTAEGDAVSVELAPSPQPEDRPGRTSQFVGRLPAEFAVAPSEISVPALRLKEARYRLVFPLAQQPHVKMPEKLLDSAERDLYLTAGGRYTAADVAANGQMTASQRYQGFQARHDVNPQPGDLLCPITRTKANPSCTWIIDGSRYSFCCPPCIDEFLRVAKSEPEQLLKPHAYRMRDE